MYTVVFTSNYVIQVKEVESLEEALEIAEKKSEGNGVFTVAIFDAEGRIVEIR